MSVTDPAEPVDPTHDSSRPTGGVDWASADHAVSVVAPDGGQIMRFSVTAGAAGLRTRAEEVGGAVDVRSAPGEGTRVTVRVPVR